MFSYEKFLNYLTVKNYRNTENDNGNNNDNKYSLDIIVASLVGFINCFESMIDTLITNIPNIKRNNSVITVSKSFFGYKISFLKYIAELPNNFKISDHYKTIVE